MKPLSTKIKLFCLNIIKGKTGKDAAIDSGYKPKTAESQASRLLRNAKVKEFIAARIEKIEEKAEVSAAYVIKNLKRVAERCMVPEPVMAFDHEEKEMRQKVDDDGNFIWEFDSAGANRALELLGKHLALFTEKVDATVREAPQINYVPAKSAHENGKAAQHPSLNGL